MQSVLALVVLVTVCVSCQAKNFGEVRKCFKEKCSSCDKTCKDRIPSDFSRQYDCIKEKFETKTNAIVACLSDAAKADKDHPVIADTDLCFLFNETAFAAHFHGLNNEGQGIERPHPAEKGAAGRHRAQRSEEHGMVPSDGNHGGQFASRHQPGGRQPGGAKAVPPVFKAFMDYKKCVGDCFDDDAHCDDACGHPSDGVKATIDRCLWQEKEGLKEFAECFTKP